MKIMHFAAAAALLMGTASLASAQTTSPPPSPPAKSKNEMGGPQQGPTGTMQNEGTGSRPIGPPADTTTPAPGKNPTGVSKEKRKGEQDDPSTGGKKQ